MREVAGAGAILILAVAYQGFRHVADVDWNDWVTNPKLVVAKGEARPGVVMHGLYATAPIKANELLLTWSTLMTPYTKETVDYVNVYDVTMYSMAFGRDGKGVLASGRLNETGMLIDTQAGYANEPSPKHIARLKSDGTVSHEAVEHNVANACLYHYSEWGSVWGPVLVATRNIDVGEEVTFYYGSDYIREDIRLGDDMTLRVGDAYEVADLKSSRCPRSPWIFFTNKPPLSEWHPRIFFDGVATEAFVEQQRRLSEGRDRQGAFHQMQRALDAYSPSKDTQRLAVRAFADWWERMQGEHK